MLETESMKKAYYKFEFTWTEISIRIFIFWFSLFWTSFGLYIDIIQFLVIQVVADRDYAAGEQVICFLGVAAHKYVVKYGKESTWSFIYSLYLCVGSSQLWKIWEWYIGRNIRLYSGG